MSVIDAINSDVGDLPQGENAYDVWRETILQGLNIDETEPALRGMIYIIREVIEGKLDAVIHLMDWQDKSGKQDSAVLSREANVHNIPIATNVDTAEAFANQWKRNIFVGKTENLFNKDLGPTKRCNMLTLERVMSENSNTVEKPKVLALIAHDGKKLEMDVFAVEHAKEIFGNYNLSQPQNLQDQIKHLMSAMGYGDYGDQICCCESGPDGGDLQIAHAIVSGVCNDIIFFQNPQVMQPHDADIRLFEQAVTTTEVKARSSY